MGLNTRARFWWVQRGKTSYKRHDFLSVLWREWLCRFSSPVPIFRVPTFFDYLHFSTYDIIFWVFNIVFMSFCRLQILLVTHHYEWNVEIIWKSFNFRVNFFENFFILIINFCTYPFITNKQMKKYVSF